MPAEKPCTMGCTQKQHCDDDFLCVPSLQENCASAVAMSSGSGNKSAIETAKSSPITARTSGRSTSGYLKLSEIRRQENSVPGDFQPVRTAEIESSLFIGMFDSHPRLVSNLRSIIHRNPRRNHSLRFPLRCSTPGMQPTRIGRSLTAMRTVPKTDGKQDANRRDTTVPQFNSRAEECLDKACKTLPCS